MRVYLVRPGYNDHSWQWYSTPAKYTHYLPLTLTEQECIDHICDLFNTQYVEKEYFPGGLEFWMSWSIIV